MEAVPNRSIIIGTLLSCLIAIGCGSTPAPVAAGPSTTAQEPAKFGSITAVPGTIELGDVNDDAANFAKFTLTNTGSKTIKLLSAQPSCGCYDVQVPAEILPGKTVTISALLRLDETYFGGRTDYILIKTDDPASKEVTVKFHGTFHPVIGFDPPSPRLFKFVPGKPVSLTVNVVPRAGTKLVKVEGNDPSFNVISRPKSDGSAEVTVESKRAMPPGDFRLQLSATATNPDHLSVYQISGEASQGPIAYPPLIDISMLVSGQPKNNVSQIMVATRSGSVNILSVTSSDKALKTTFQKEGSVYVSYVGGWSKGYNKKGTLTIKTTDKKFPMLTVPFVVRVLN